MKKHALTFIALALFAALPAQNNTDIDSIRIQFEQEAEDTKAEFEKYSEEARAEYERYEKEMRAEYFNYISSIKNVWGEDSILDDTKTEWVEYSDDYNARSIVDFDNGDITVQIVLEDIHYYDSLEIDRRLSAAIEKMLESRGTTCPYNSKADKREHLTNAPILDNLVDLSTYEFEDDSIIADTKLSNKRPTPPSPTVRGKELEIARNDSTRQDIAGGNNGTMASRVKNDGSNRNIIQEQRDKAREKYKKMTAKTIAKTVARQSKKEIFTIKGNDNKKRTVVEVQMSLVTDNLSKNAALYKDYIKKYSQTFQIEEPLIYAVMEQESRFNPEATSWVPAYGLMQLVPKSGGYDAYNYVYKREWIPTKSYLFVPHQNIELGTAYLRILMNQFSGVTDPDCRRLCVIAGYNTGAGNVSRAFTGTTSVVKAIPHINKYNYQELYNYLTKNLSHEEARNYVSGVSKRREKYLK